MFSLRTRKDREDGPQNEEIECPCREKIPHHRFNYFSLRKVYESRTFSLPGGKRQ